MSKSKKIMITLLVVALLALATVAIILIVQNSNREKTATTVMSCSVNPAVQFVLNANDKVMAVTATNDDGEAIIVKGEFIGLSAEDAAELFISLSAEAGYIDVNATSDTGAEVTINLDGIGKDYKHLQKKITDSVNGYFDENGIVGGAVTKITNDLKTAIQNISTENKTYLNETNEDLIEDYLEMAQKLDHVSRAKYVYLEEQFDLIEDVYEEATAISQVAFASYKAMLDTVKTTLLSHQQDLDDYEEIFEIVEAEDADDLKEEIEEARRLMKNAPSYVKGSIETLINIAQAIYDSMEDVIKEARAKFEADYKVLVEQLKEESKALLENVKTTMETKMANYKATFEARKNYFEKNKESVRAEIKAFRDKLYQA